MDSCSFGHFDEGENLSAYINTKGKRDSKKRSHPIRAGSVWMVVVRQSFNCVVVRDHSLTGQRMAPHTPQESPKVKTKCIGIGLTRLYAPMVPLAPHPCVRWWNTEEMSLKLTRLSLHSLRGGSTHQKTIPPHPVGQMSSPARLASLPKTTRSGGVDTNGQGAVFHPLNGSGARGPTGRSNAGRRKQKDSPKGFTQEITKQGWCCVRLYRTSPRFPPVHLFFFGVQNHFFFCNQKKKWFWPLLGRQKPTVR